MLRLERLLREIFNLWKKTIKSSWIENDHVKDKVLRAGKFNGTTITGTSNATAETEDLHAHGLGAKPKIVIVVKGDVYVSTVDDTNIGVKSTKISEPFEIFAML